jgi:sigma-B regulation protein RsbU (phosphoserine phosphatase)
MQQSLKQYIADLTTTVAAKERIESELSIAREIQMGIIPKAFPAFPQHNEFNVFAMIETAKEVGGDFYDFFFIDEQQLCFVIADVSGKGIPASLFMAVTKTLIKATAHDEKMPDPILTRVNKELSTENTTGMFVTVFCGILNIGTGEVYYANGGHNPPLLIKNNGDVSFLESRGEPVIGAVDDYIYTRGSLILNKGDALFLYTDGVNEAMNKAGELYGTTRMQNKMLALAGSPIETVLKGMMDDISAFSRGAEQSDDITMMMLQFRGNAQ